MKYFSKQELIEAINNKTLPDYVFIPPWKLITVSADICALANTKGGTLIYGIEEDFSVIGAYDADFFVKIIKKRASLINPKPNYSIYKYIIYDKDVILVNVEELPLTEKLAYVNIYAYFMKNKQRVIASSIEKSYYSFLKGYSTELLQEGLFVNRLLDQDLFKKFINKARLIMNKKYTDFQIEGLYNMRNNKRYPTFCKELCFGMYPQAFHPNSDLMIYDHRKEYKLIRRVTGNIYYMLKDSMVFLKQYLGLALYIDKNKEVVRKEAYPVVVLQEAIYNSLIHRDHNKVLNITSNEIHIYDSSIEILNPGGFPYEGDLKNNKLKIPRNPGMKKINDLLLETKPQDRGIDSIYFNMKKHGYVEPKVYYADGIFKVTLYNNTIYDFYNNKISVKKICKFCEMPRTRKELYDYFYPNGKSTPYYFISKYIFPLINNGVLKLTDEKHKKSKNQKIVLNVMNEN